VYRIYADVLELACTCFGCLCPLRLLSLHVRAYGVIDVIFQQIVQIRREFLRASLGSTYVILVDQLRQQFD